MRLPKINIKLNKLKFTLNGSCHVNNTSHEEVNCLGMDCGYCILDKDNFDRDKFLDLLQSSGRHSKTELLDITLRQKEIGK